MLEWDPARVLRVYYLALFIEEAPAHMNLSLGKRRVSLKRLVRWVKRSNPELYIRALEAYGCESETCLAIAMSRVFYSAFSQHISLREGPVKAGDLHGPARELREWARSAYSLLR